MLANSGHRIPLAHMNGGWKMRDRLHSEAMVEHFRANPAYAAMLLAEVRRDGDLAELAILIRQIAAARPEKKTI